MSENPTCPKCKGNFVYQSEELYICPECFHEWNIEQITDDLNTEELTKVIDANGNELQNGDAVIVIKDLPVKGAAKPIKAGTKVKNIRLVPDSDHNIDCKIEGFGAMSLKSIFVKKA